jgi:uncharacterized protein
VSLLTTHDEVDPDRIGVLGICASGGYALAAGATDHRIKAVGTVSAVDMGRQFRVGADGTQGSRRHPGHVGGSGDGTYRRGPWRGRPDLPHLPRHRGGSPPRWPARLRRLGVLLHPRAQHPRSAKSLTWTSVDRIATFDAFSSLDLLAPRPLYMIVGREAVTSWMSVEAFQRASGPKDLVWIDGAMHTDLYDKDEYVKPAVAKLTDFFDSHLAQTT